MPEKTIRRLAAIVSTDVVGYSRLMGMDEIGTLDALKKSRAELIDPLISRYNGRIVKTMGDGLLLEFASVVQATRCVIDIQLGMATRNENIPEAKRMILRAGINLGDVIIEGDDIFGDGVNIAARLQETAEPGGVTIADRVHEDVQDRLDIVFENAGERELKNIARAIRVWKWSPSAALGQSQPGNTASAKLSEKASIAVLPFDNMSGDPEQEYFSDGITEDIITDLSKISELFVIARNSTFVYKGRAVDFREVAKKFGVRYILEGSVRQAGGRVRINAQLIDAANGDHLWADRFDGEMKDIFALQDQITESIVSTLAITLTRAEHARAMRKTPQDIKAYDQVLKANSHYSLLNEEGISTSIPMYEQAIKLDPDYAPAYAGLASALAIHSNQGWAKERQLTFERAFENAREALRLDNNLAAAHVALGGVYCWTNRCDQAIIEGRKAVALDPSYAEGHFMLAFFLTMASQGKEAVEEAEKALRYNPIHAPGMYYSPLSMANYQMGDYEAAAVAAGRGLSRDPDNIGHLSWLAAAQAQSGRLEEAESTIEDILKRQPNSSMKKEREYKYAYKNQSDIDHYHDGLRKAGMPEG